ncbi:MAG: amidase [Alphaproteobacteria bacterium]
MADVPLNQLSAVEVTRGVADGRFSCEDVTRACLARVETREDRVGAWIHIDPDQAIAQARAQDRAGRTGLLLGATVGVKDIIDTFDMPTGMGSPIYDGNRPLADASCVGLSRAAGAVILGKTVSCEFAGRTPGRTSNPHDATRTPGGSSSGSGAAVADFMAHLAFGTQTAGSVLRPSAYCGIVGYKPTFNSFNRAGIKFAAESLDTIGLHARTVGDIDLFAAALTGRDTLEARPVESAPTIGLCRTPMWDKAEAESRAALEDAAARLEKAGCSVRDFILPNSFSGLEAARNTLNDVERWRVMAYEWAHARDAISPALRDIVRRGGEVPHSDYLAALVLAEDCRAQMAGLLDGYDFILSPSANGEAPVGLDWTGDPAFQGLWTTLHAPSITLPTHKGPNGMPVGIQLIGRRYEDTRLLADADWVLNRLGAWR